MEPWIPVLNESSGITLQDWVTLGAGIGGALLGSLVGGFVTWGVARANRSAERATAAQNEVDRKKALLINAQFQASLILSDVDATIRAVDESLEEANAMGLTGQPLATRMMIVVGMMDTPAIDFETLGPLIAARENALVHSFIEAHTRHKVLTAALLRHEIAKNQLHERMSPHLVPQPGGRPIAELSPEVSAQLRPYIEMADTLAAQIRPLAVGVKEAAATATFGIGPAARQMFKDDKFPILEPKDGSPDGNS